MRAHLSSLSHLSPRPTIDDRRDDATAITQARTPRVKELVERVSGVPAATQRLLCRGRVLSDDASMESARVEDGDTLLLVKRAPERAEANPALANDPHAPENAEASGGRAGAGGGTIGDLSQMITSLLTSNPAMLGAAMGAGGGAVTVEFSIANGGEGGNARTREGGARAATGGRPGESARANERGANGEAVVTRAPEETLRRYVDAVERMVNDVRERRAQPLVTNAAAAAAARNQRGAATTPTVEETTEDGREGTIHYGVQCDSCDVNPVRGTRYKSVAHDDFDLCATCFAAGRGSQCGPFTRLDLPLPAGLPPVIHHEDANSANANERTPSEQSEASVATLGQFLRAAADIAANTAPLMNDVAGRYAPSTRQNTVETQAQGLQLAALMHSVGSLWCELARCISVVPPPPDAMTPEGAAVAGDDIDSTRSLFNYPQPSYIASDGAFAHTRPPGMPLHTQANFAAFAQQARAAGQSPGVMHVVHHVTSGPNGTEGLDQLPPEIRALMTRQAEANQNQAAPGSQTSTEASDSAVAGQRSRHAAQRAHARRHAHVQSSQRMLSRLLGTVFRAIPSPSFMGSQTVANNSQAHARRHTAAQPQAADAGPPAPAVPPVERSAAPSTRDDAPPSRSRMRSETNEDTNDRAAKASNTGNGLSPAASAAQFATRDADADMAAKSTAGDGARAAGPSRGAREEGAKKDDDARDSFND